MNKEQFHGSSRYYINPELEAITNMALALEKPLLLTGEPGTGKTQLAFEIARTLEMPIETLRAKSTIKGEEVCYVQDTLLRLNDARFGNEGSGRDINNFFDYIIWGPIGRAFNSDSRSVLLLDEIDKTESDVQDNLLDVLEECQFTIREVNRTVQAVHNPLIVITSNAKRELSDPFLRRCFCYHIPFPTEDEMVEIVKLHFPQIKAELLDSALQVFYDLRRRDLEKPPATSELLNWLEALQKSGQAAEDLPFIGILLKRTTDLIEFRQANAR